jgi:hypothetical protein
MFLWALLLGGASSGPYVNPTYDTGILHPIVDTAGNFSINEDPDAATQPRELTANIDPE